MQCLMNLNKFWTVCGGRLRRCSQPEKRRFFRALTGPGPHKKAPAGSGRRGVFLVAKSIGDAAVIWWFNTLVEAGYLICDYEVEIEAEAIV